MGSVLRQLLILFLALPGVAAGAGTARVVNLNAVAPSTIRDRDLREFIEHEKVRPLVFEKKHHALRDRLGSFLERLLIPEDGMQDIYFMVTHDQRLNAQMTLLANDRKAVTITSGLLEYLESDSQLAVVLGHELEHLHSGLRPMRDPRSRYVKFPDLLNAAKNNRSAEVEVDARSLYRRVAQKGHSPFAGFELFDRMHKDFGLELSGSHPLALSRREVSGFVGSLAVRAAGVEAPDRLGTGATKGTSLLSDLRKELFDTEAYRQQKRRAVESVLKDPQTRIELVATRLKTGQSTNGLPASFYAEFEENWRLIEKYQGRMSLEERISLQNRLYTALEDRYAAAYAKHFPESHRIRSTDEFQGVLRWFFERYVSFRDTDLASSEIRLKGLRDAIASAEKTLSDPKPGEWEKTEAYERLEKARARLAEEERATAAKTAEFEPPPGWNPRSMGSRTVEQYHDLGVPHRTVSPRLDRLEAERKAFLRRNKHVLGMPPPRSSDDAASIRIAKPFLDIELSPSEKEQIVSRLDAQLSALMQEARTPMEKREAVRRFRAILLPEYEIGSFIAPSFVLRLHEAADPELKKRIEETFRKRFRELVSRSDTPEEWVALLNEFAPERFKRGPFQGELRSQAQFVREQGLFLGEPESRELIAKLRASIDQDAFGPRGFPELHELLKDLAEIKTLHGKDFQLSEEQTYRLLHTYASRYESVLREVLPASDIPPLKELEAHLLVREGSLFRTIAGLKSNDAPSNPVGRYLPRNELEERLTRLSKRDRYLDRVAGWDLHQAGEWRSEILRKVGLPEKQNLYYGMLISPEELSHFLFDQRNPDAFFEWLSQRPRLLVRRQRHDSAWGYWGENHFVRQLLRHEDPLLLKIRDNRQSPLGDLRELFHEEYHSGRMSLAQILERSEKLARLSGDPDYARVFFEDASKILLHERDSAESFARRLAEVATELDGIAQKQGVSLAQFLDAKGMKKMSVPQAFLGHLANPDFVAKASAKELARDVPFLLQTLGPSTETDELFSNAWKKIEKADPRLLDAFMEPRLVRKLKFDNHSLELAKKQLEHRFQLKARYREQRALRNVPSKGESRAVVAEVRDFIAMQFPEKSLLGNQVLDHAAKSLVATPEEARMLRSLRLDPHAAQQAPDALHHLDLLGAVEAVTSSPHERYQLMEWVLGARAEFPRLSEVSKHSEAIHYYTGLSKLPDEHREALQLARRAFADGVHPLAQTFALQVLLDHRDGVLAHPLTREKLYDFILGEYGESKVIRKIFVGYAEALPVAERRTFLSHLLVRKSAGGKEGLALREIFQAKGPLGAKIAQFLRSAGAVPAKYRRQFDGVFDDVLAPNRDRIIEYFKKAFGEGLGPIRKVGDIKGSGSLAFAVEVEIATPSAPKGKRVVFRFLKEEAPGQIANENQVEQKLVMTLLGDSDPDVRKAGDFLSHVRGTVMESLDPRTGRELNLAHELASTKRAARVYDRPPRGLTGFRIEAVRVDEEVLGLLPEALRNRLVPYEAIDVTPWDEVPASLRKRLAAQVLEAELDALLVKGEFDPDGHPGNWWVDLEKKRLVRGDVSQITKFKDSSKAETFKRLLKGLVYPEMDAKQIRQFADDVPRFFDLSHPLSGMEALIQGIVTSPEFPSNTSPHERLFFIQERLMKAYQERGIRDGAVKLTSEMQNALGSLSRMSYFAREVAEPHVFAALLFERMDLPLHLRALAKGARVAASIPGFSCVREKFGGLLGRLKGR